jgi:hypothetical protein
MKSPELLEIYADYLICVPGLATATGLSSLTGGSLSHDKISRFLEQPVFSRKEYWRAIKPLLREIQSEDGVIIIDDTILEKPYTDENQLVCVHYDHCTQNYVRGINIISALYSAPGEPAGANLPLDYRLITKSVESINKKTGAVEYKSPTTKNEYAREMISLACRAYRIPFRYVLGDSWFCSADNMKAIHEIHHKKFIFAIKANRSARLFDSENIKGSYKNIEGLGIKPDEAVKAWLKGLNFPVLLTRAVFTDKNGKECELYLVTNDLELDPAAIKATYQKRWAIEVFHKSVKQNASLEKSPTKMQNSQKNHIFASMIAYCRLEIVKTKLKINHFSIKASLQRAALIAAAKEFTRLKEATFSSCDKSLCMRMV